MKKLVVLLTCLLAWGIGFAQKKGAITGKVVDEKGAGLGWVTLKLSLATDTNLVLKQQTDTNGNFSFIQPQPGNYNIVASAMGFQTVQSDLFKFNGVDLKIPNIQLLPTAKQLHEVTVKAKQPLVEFKADKTILNVETSILANGGTILEVLEKAPGVTVDRQNDQIKLNNKSGITVMIDGKTNFLSGTDITTLLGNMGSDQVATIELIASPSSKYDAAGSAGIINIKLKRNKSFGTNGNLSLNTGQGVMPKAPSNLYRAGLQLTLNHRVNKWNVYGVTAFNRKVGYNNTQVNRTTQTNELFSAFDQNFDRNNESKFYMLKVGTDYYASEKTIIGVMVDANAINTNLSNLSQTLIAETRNSGQTSNTVDQQANGFSPVRNVTANFNVRHDFDKNGKSLLFDVDYSEFSNRKTENFLAQYVNASNITDRSTALRNTTDAQIDIYAAKTDLTWPIAKTVKFEFGLKSSYVVTNNDFVAEQLLNGAWQNDVGKSNYFIYKENINAAYTNFSKEWKNFQLQMGIRAEHTHSNGNSITDQNEVDRNYISVFPTFFVNQKLSENSNLRYSYSRRVDRPNYQQLNPFVFYMDPYALDEGNPYLDPQFTQNMELGYSYKEISFSVNYAYTKDLITQISQQNEMTRIVNVIRKNFGSAQNISANVYVPINVASFWKMQNNFSVYFNKFNDDNLEGAAYVASKVAYQVNHTNSFILPYNFTAELGFWLNSPRINGVEETTITQYAVNAGVQKNLMNKKMRIRLGIDDIFLTNRWEGRLKYQNVNLEVVNRYLSRRVSFSVNYNFGNQQVKSARDRNTAADDMKSRAN